MQPMTERGMKAFYHNVGRICYSNEISVCLYFHDFQVVQRTEMLDMIRSVY